MDAGLIEGERARFVADADASGQRLDQWLAARLAPDLSRSRVQALIRQGAVLIDGMAAGEPKRKLAAGEQVEIAMPEPEPATPQGEAIPLDILYEDDELIVVNKPAGLVVHPGAGNWTGTLVNALIHHCGESLSGIGGVRRPGIVHRLDKDTSGVLLLARSARAAAHFAKAFSSRSVRKVYWAIIVGVPSIDDGYIDLPLAKQPGTGGEKMHVDEAEGAPARTRYRVIERAGNRAAWVELQPHTGRTHQLRVHMAAIGHPIVGDGKYGGKDAFLSGTISRKMHLHARRLRIDHPDGSPLDVKADLPRHFAETLADLGFDMAEGDLPLEEKAPSKEEEKAAARRAAAAHAKDVRKARRGERRGRIGAKGKPTGPKARAGGPAARSGKPARPGKPRGAGPGPGKPRRG